MNLQKNQQNINGSVGQSDASVKMGSKQPMQHRGNLPQYRNNKLKELQAKRDKLEYASVFARLESIGVSTGYINHLFPR